jgi:hypothetical protein
VIVLEAGAPLRLARSALAGADPADSAGQPRGTLNVRGARLAGAALADEDPLACFRIPDPGGLQGAAKGLHVGDASIHLGPVVAGGPLLHRRLDQRQRRLVVLLPEEFLTIYPEESGGFPLAAHERGADGRDQLRPHLVERYPTASAGTRIAPCTTVTPCTAVSAGTRVAARPRAAARPGGGPGRGRSGIILATGHQGDRDAQRHRQQPSSTENKGRRGGFRSNSHGRSPWAISISEPLPTREPPWWIRSAGLRPGPRLRAPAPGSPWSMAPLAGRPSPGSPRPERWACRGSPCPRSWTNLPPG